MSCCQQLMSWGSNSHGQLGLGSTQSDEILLPTIVDLSSLNLKPESIVKIVGGAGHSLILDDEGKVYGCGWNDKGQVGTDQQYLQFKYLKSLETVTKGQLIIDIACGWNSSMALTQDGKIYGWGSNSYGQLGLPMNECCKNIDVPVEIKVEFRVKRIAMGLRHSAVVSIDHELFATGCNRKGQLGSRVVTKSVNSFTKISDVENVAEISCGQHHTVAVTKSNNIYCWGDNKFGQLGIDPLTSKQYNKIQMNFAKVNLEIHCGWTHSVLLNGSDEVLLWGRNSYGQLGVPLNITESFWKPHLVKFSHKVKQISVGSEHNLALLENGQIFSWGWNEHGNCGSGEKLDLFSPTRITFPGNSIGIKIGSGAGHSFAILKTNIF